jgi:hypothetical protein
MPPKRGDSTLTFRSRRTRRLKLLSFFAALFLLAVWLVPVCFRAWIFQAILVPACPVGTMHQTLSVAVNNLRRGEQAGSVLVSAIAYYTPDASDEAETATVRRIEPSLALVDAAGKETPLVPKKDWSNVNNARLAEIALPKVPDGDYSLRTRVHSPIGDSSYDLPLAIYAPAKIHVITDRPLYEPGNLVQFRAVVLRSKDLAPLDGRPGLWSVIDPSNETVLEEKAKAGDYGVAASSFPLDSGATPGVWRVRYQSGTAQTEVTFRVEPFTLPRFHVDASAPKPFYRSGERPVLRGTVLYSSGAPVASAAIDLDWSVIGDWPPPTSWLDGGLAKRAKSDAAGRFVIELPQVPGDLRGKASLIARIGATDPAHDRVEGSASILLSEDAIDVAFATELGDGLADGSNNRVYLRAASASGEVLAKTELRVRRAWQPKDPGIVATTDEDGVASVQIDPGAPVNIVIPPMPMRPPRRTPPLSRGGTTELLKREAPPLADQLALDAALPALTPCARFSENGGEGAVVALRVDAKGAVADQASSEDLVGACLGAVLKTKRFSPGAERLYRIEFQVADPDLPKLVLEDNAVPASASGLVEAVTRAALDARTCLPELPEEARLSRVLAYSVTSKQKAIKTSFVPDPAPRSDRLRVSEAAESCIGAKMKSLALVEPASSNSLGYVRFTVEPPHRMVASRPVATTMLGYELVVAAKSGNEAIGSTKIRLPPGAIPDLRLRANPILAEPGQKVEVTILRGPNFHGELPKKLYMNHVDMKSVEAELDPKTRTAAFEIPGGGEGWYAWEWGGARALVYVRPKAELAVEMRPGEPHYAPGQTARLDLLTKIGGKGSPAGVTLIGVDESLSQLVPLPGPDDMAALRPKVASNGRAFNVLDAEALTMGRIRGSNAAAATVLRVSALPPAEMLDTSVNGAAAQSFEPLEALTDHFYTALSELYLRVREWEDKAPAGEQMHPQTMARLWNETLDALAKRGEHPTDAFGRKLRLSLLPPDLLALTDPRSVVSVGTRLPEDVENWAEWVQKERP